MNRLRLNLRVTGCPNKCFHCHCRGGGNTKVFFDTDTIIKTASFFRDKLNTDVSVLLLDEQTYYPGFFELIARLEAEGFMYNGNQKFLVTNCWGLKNVPGFIDQLNEHYYMVIPTIFGISGVHDMHVRRKGNYDEIIYSTKECLLKGLKVMWHLQWSKLNTEDMIRLYEIGESIGVTAINISGEYYFSGFYPDNAEEFHPVSDDFNKIKHRIAEHELPLLKTANQIIDDIKNGILYDVKKVPFDGVYDIYINEKFDIYPLTHHFEKYRLGNLDDPECRIIEQIQHGCFLPKAIINKRNQDFSELVLKYADTSSNKLYTPQTLFDKLCLEHVG